MKRWKMRSGWTSECSIRVLIDNGLKLVKSYSNGYATCFDMTFVICLRCKFLATVWTVVLVHGNEVRAMSKIQMAYICCSDYIRSLYSNYFNIRWPVAMWIKIKVSKF